MILASSPDPLKLLIHIVLMFAGMGLAYGLAVSFLVWVIVKIVRIVERRKKDSAGELPAKS